MNSGVTTKQGIADWRTSKVNNRHPDHTPDVGSLWWHYSVCPTGSNLHPVQAKAPGGKLMSSGESQTRQLGDSYLACSTSTLHFVGSIV